MLEKFLTIFIALRMRFDALLTELDLISIVYGKVAKQIPDGNASGAQNKLVFRCDNYPKMLEQISKLGTFCISDSSNCSKNSKVFFEIGEQILYLSLIHI